MARDMVDRCGWCLWVMVGVFLYLSSPLWSASWVNPRETLSDPMIVRLQQGRKNLNELEKQEVEQYGYTGLEVMTYLDYNEDPGQDNDSIQTFDLLDSVGSVRTFRWLHRIKYYYKTWADLYNNTPPNPGDVWRQTVSIFFGPPEFKRNALLKKNFLRSIEQKKPEERWMYLASVRRIRRDPIYDFEDEWVGSCLSHDDREYRKAWQEEHRILGEDSIDNQLCLVIESEHSNSNYYLSKRVTWVTKDNFLDLHEEQFDKKGRLFRIVDNNWEQKKPGNYWTRIERNCVDLSSEAKGFHQLYGWKFDQGLSESFFSQMQIQKENYWRPIVQPPIQIKTAADFPPDPKIRREFWKKIRIEPLVAK
jgi:hypothetical protein